MVKNFIFEDREGIKYYPKTTDNQVKMADGRNLSNYNATQNKDGFMTKEDKTKLDNLENYTHPNNSNTRHVSDEEKTTWNNKANANHSHFVCQELFNENLNELLDDGLVGVVNPNCTNKPTTTGYYYIFNITWNKRSFTQLAIGYNTHELWLRYKFVDAEWSSWRQVSLVSTYSLQKQVEEELLNLEMEALKNGY